jgi:hypothetical protein
MPSFGMLCRVVPVRTDISEERIASIPSSETSVLTRATRHNIPEDDIHRRGRLKSYIALTGWPLLWRRNKFPVKHELGFYISKDGILHGHRIGNVRAYIVHVADSIFGV